MAIPTLLDLITEALVDIGELGVGNSVSPEDASYLMAKANEFLDSCSTERLNIYTLQQLQLRLLVAKQTFTIGPGAADFNQARPIKIEGAVTLIPMAVTSVLMSSPMEIVGEARWRAISDLSATTNAPEMLYPDYAAPIMNLNFYPAPRVLVATYAQLTVWVPLQQFASVTDLFGMPTGYQAFFVQNLKIVVMKAYGHEIDQATADLALTYKQRVQELNASQPNLGLTNGIPSPAPQQ